MNFPHWKWRPKGRKFAENHPWSQKSFQRSQNLTQLTYKPYLWKRLSTNIWKLAMASCLAVSLKELNLTSKNCSVEWNLVLNSGPAGSACEKKNNWSLNTEGRWINVEQYWVRQQRKHLLFTSTVDLLRVDKSSPVAVINHDIKPACVPASKRIAIFFLWSCSLLFWRNNERWLTIP